MKKLFMAVIALMMTISASAQFYIYCKDGSVIVVDSISMIAPVEPEDPTNPDAPDAPDEPAKPNETTIEIPAEAASWNIPEGAIDVLQAREICAALESGATTGTKYYVMGYVKKIHNKHADGVANYGNALFYMENVSGANSTDDFLAYQVYGLNGQRITEPNVVAVGDFVVVYGELTNYNGTYETVGKGAAYIWNSTNALLSGGSDTPEDPEPETPDTPDPDTPDPDTPAGAVTFDADVDQGNAGTDSNNATAYTITKNGVTVEVSSGILGTYNNEMHYRVYKNQTLTVTSTVGNITSVEFTCTADDDAKYGPGCLTADGGDYTYSGPVGTWTGSAEEVVFTAATNQVRATQIVVTISGISAFSVSVTKQVTFSKGNLQYTQSTNTWSFASAQWEMLGTENVTGGSVSSNPKYGDSKSGTALADKVDLFGWSTAATNFGVSTSTNDNDYSGSFVDWGTNKIGNDAPNTWRTLSRDEWDYLLNGRPNASSLCGVAQVNGVNGLIFLPDNWTCPAGVIFKSGFHSEWGVDYYAAYQTFTADQWSKMESAGAVFLPAAGNRFGALVYDVQGLGDYWSASEGGSDDAYSLYFYSGEARVYDYYRYEGRSVRLVKDL